MQTCSNCGASVRVGAKFCTTCGTKLNAPATDGASTWASTPNEETVKETTNESTEAVVDETEQTEDANETSTWSWGSTADPVAETNTDEENEVTTAADTSENDGESSGEAMPEDRSNRTFRWSWNAPPAQAETGETVEAAEVASGEQPEAVAEDDVAGAETESQREEGTDALASWASSWSDPEDSKSSTTGDDQAEPVAPEAVPAKEDAFTRVNALITELQGLLPALDRDRGTDGVTDKLTGATTGLTDASGLREALEAARDNPRDITTIMELAGKSGDLLAILDERDRLSATITEAVDTLT